ncbi:hypothetical protein E2C01_068559 [Portunus trituberculatus]|uniref:Uncharacterized protein n=1 Tax=Portunus trituberculatus TaxID=210409 RepID=A0A5B7HY69_PORTR|nr:hypothetical protein [Portunus trituberculatus]
MRVVAVVGVVGGNVLVRGVTLVVSKGVVGGWGCEGRCGGPKLDPGGEWSSGERSGKEEEE